MNCNHNFYCLTTLPELNNNHKSKNVNTQANEYIYNKKKNKNNPIIVIITPIPKNHNHLLHIENTLQSSSNINPEHSIARRSGWKKTVSLFLVTFNQSDNSFNNFLKKSL